ncbi:MAG TPA: GNAT family N-acetyltransferase [Ruminococcus flavefaciens]|nr:GNAT family N-acetyltransferase [Ruminococcus flavefaciens]
MYIIKAEQNQIKSIVGMSIRAFETDMNVGGKKGDCPPEFDSIEWHRKMSEEGRLFQAIEDEKLVGAAILFPDTSHKSLYIGRIFIDSIYHRKGYGILLMKCIENEFPYVSEINLDTPSWNVRTNAFYKKLGYKKVKIEDGFVFYQKKK